MKIKKITSLIICFAFVLGFLNISAFADAEPETADVYIAAQASGGFLTAPETVTVAENTAESYGFTDEVDGVSVLDALVKTHELIFGEDFTSATANTYLAAAGGYVSKVFGIQTYAFGFLLNGGTPNDGTDSQYGGYNGTTVATQKIDSGDKLDFFIYRDQSYYSDIYTWIDGDLTAAPGSEITLNVSGSSAMMGYLYKTPADFKAAAEPAEGVFLAWIGENGILDAIDGAATDENGNVTITVPSDFTSGVYYITATGTDDSDAPVIMNPTKIKITNDLKAEISAEYASNTLTVNINVKNNTSDAVSGAAYAAVYSAEGILKGISLKALNLSSGANTAAVTIDNYAYESGDYAKAFIWNSNLAPLCRIKSAAVTAAVPAE